MMGIWRRFRRWLETSAQAESRPLQITFYTRAGCQLCDEALELLRDYGKKYPLTIQEIDVDSQPELADRYGDKVPVLEIEGKPRLWGRINEVLLRRLLRGRS